ncbi:MAG TPA: hypothetical protein VL093_13585 [Flavipsychrobacter sp.]|nr:hypothetical protein [Flavipsychrobacter sp.]
MSIYKINQDKIVPLVKTTFANEKIREELHLQKFIVNSIEVIDPNLFVVCTEYSNWQDSRREIDILALDKEANLVVIEIKRTDDGGHMELQAIRYAAMVSNMKFKDVIDAYQKYSSKNGMPTDNCQSNILDFLGWQSPDEELFNSDVKIILVSSNFSIEITTSVLWLNERDLDIRCIAITPHKDNEIYLEIQQQIPLKEAREFQVRQKEKAAEERKSRLESIRKRDNTKYDIKIIGREEKSLSKRHAFYTVVKAAIETGISPDKIIELTSERCWLTVDKEIADIPTLEKEIRLEKPNYDPRRWFIRADEIFVKSGKTYIFSNQHGGTFPKNAILNIFYHYPDLNGEIVESEDQNLH